MYKIATKLLAESSSEPITLEEAKLFLRVTNDKENSLIISLIKAVRNAAENYLRKSIITQEWRAYISNFTNNKIILPKNPIQKIDSVFRVGAKDEKIMVKANDYFLDDSSDSLVFRKRVINSGLIVNYTTGYKKISDIPASLI